VIPYKEEVLAKEAYDTVDLKLQDGTEVTVKPLNIGRLKPFMSAWAKFKEIDLEQDELAAFDIYINCAGIGLEPALGHKFTTRGEGDEVLDPKYREYLEDVLDMDTIFKVLEVAGGLKLNDPNLLEAVARAQGGTN
jgi:hypothetical protein